MKTLELINDGLGNPKQEIAVNRLIYGKFVKEKNEMTDGIRHLLTIQISFPVILAVMGMILAAIALLKKNNRYGRRTRTLMIVLLVILLAVSVYLFCSVFALWIPQPSSIPMPSQGR